MFVIKRGDVKSNNGAPPRAHAHASQEALCPCSRYWSRRQPHHRTATFRLLNGRAEDGEQKLQQMIWTWSETKRGEECGVGSFCFCSGFMESGPGMSETGLGWAEVDRKMTARVQHGISSTARVSDCCRQPTSSCRSRSRQWPWLLLPGHLCNLPCLQNDLKMERSREVREIRYL